MRKWKVWIFVLAILALLSVPVIAQQDNRAWLPFVASGNVVTSAGVGGRIAGITPAQRPAHIPADWVQHPDGPDGKPAWGPDISKAPVAVDRGPEGTGPASVEAGKILYSDGPETKGQELHVGGGKLVKMPSDMYVKYYIAEHTCLTETYIDGRKVTLPPCPETPLQIIAREGTTDTIILLADGQFVVETENPQTFARVVSIFHEVTGLALKPPIMDPRLPLLAPEDKPHAIP